FHARLRAEALNDPSRAAKARNDLLEGLASLSVFDVTPYYSELGGILGIFPHEVQRLLEDQRRLTTKKPIGSEEKGQSGFDALPAREYADDVEYMFCSLLWSREDMRGLCRAEEVLQYIEDPLIQSIVYALLGGETPEMLEQRWQQMGDKIGMEIIARGNSLLSNNGIDDETAEKLIDTLRRRYLKKRLALLVSKIKAGKITDREYEDYLRFTRLLKGGNLRA
ncbi:MAG: hypothetical protein HUJ86_01695, partial [Synergistes sp.]|nr:hypothetical protein [Synergistes sp.]